jgi:hypothetical protein
VPNRKTRTREHVIADISENHFEKFALMKGFSTESTAHDYGYDIQLSTYDQTGEIENGFVMVQLKATDHLKIIKHNSIISFAVDKRDLDLWLKEFYPVIFVVYDAKKHIGYWIYLQAYFQALAGFSLSSIRKSINLHIPISNKISKGAMANFKRYKNKLYSQVQNVIHSN